MCSLSDQWHISSSHRGITARPHAVVTRQEGDLLRPEARAKSCFDAGRSRDWQEIQLSAGSLAEAGEMCGMHDSGKRAISEQKHRGLLHCSSAWASRAQALH